MKRVLLLYYSQTGDGAKIAETFVSPLRAAPDVEVTAVEIRPKTPYPFPWGTMGRMLSIFPECHIGGGCEIEPLAISPDEKFDLVVLAYQVWFLAPSLPIQGFFKSPHVRLLRGAKTITLCTCRNMWHAGSETMKELLRTAGAVHLDNVVVTHQGPASATYVSVPRMLLTGKRDRFLGVFPPAEIATSELERVARLGKVVADALPALSADAREPLLTGQGAVSVIRHQIIPEALGWRMYQDWSRLVLFMERMFGATGRGLTIGLFRLYLVLNVTIGLPVLGILSLPLIPFLILPVERRAKRLAEPSGEAKTGAKEQRRPTEGDAEEKGK